MKHNLTHRLIEMNRDAHFFGDCRHPFHDRGAAADGVKYPVLVFEKGQNRKQARAVERRHPQILGLKRKRQADARVAKVAPEFGFQREPRAQERQHLHERPRYDRTPTEERILEHILESRQLLAVVGEEAAKVGRIGRRHQADLLFHPRDVRRGQ